MLRAAAGIAVLTAAAGAAAVLASRGQQATTTSSGAVAEQRAAAQGTPTSATGTDYERYTTDRSALQAALPALLRGNAGPAGSTDSAASGPLTRLRDPGTLAGCVAALSRPGEQAVPLALDYASYAGSPALAVVLPAPVAGRVDVYVVGPQCGPGEDATLYSVQLPRPG